tara:strand:- start:6507 stop:8069 length:1563 start_codon:yes stop_codon:yes gene_type:complete
MRIVELIIDENDEASGIEAISLVETPAIESNFIALNKHQVALKEIDAEKKILMGAALIPDKSIYRRNEKTNDEYYIYFSKDTVRKASELFFKRSNHKNATFEHQKPIENMTIVESWIVEDAKKDKTTLYGMDVPVGTWMVSMKVDDENIYEKAKSGTIKGFSIEGYFADKYDMTKEETFEDFEKKMLVEELKELLQKQELESYSDYPESVRNNAKRGIELNKAVGNKCATQVGKVRAQQLANGEAVSEETVKRMFSYLSRAETYYDKGDKESCGYISYLLWGGKSAKTWAESKLKQIEREELASMLIDDNFAIIDDRLAYSSEAMAEKAAKDVGVDGIHEHEYEGKTWFMVGKTHELDLYGKCPKGYEKKDGKCVKKKSEYAEIGPRGGVRRSKKAPKGDTPNPNPKGKGTAKGDASTSRGAKVSKADEESLRKKSNEFNERYKDKLGYGANVGALKSVFQRGLGAFNKSHSPKVKSARQWAMARVNAFLYLLKNGRPQNAKYTTDYDLLPAKHPKSSKK